MQRFRCFAALLSVIVCGSGLLGFAPVTHAQPRAWAQISGVPPSVTFNDVVMLDTETAWAVGQDGSAGVIYRVALSTTVWRTAPEARFSAPLQAIAVIAPNNIWAVGAKGMFHKSDAGWEPVALPVDAQLSTIQLLGDGSTGWAGGSSAPDSSGQRHQLVLRYQAGRWQVDPFFSGAGQIQSLHFASATSGWAVGTMLNDSTGIWRYHDGHWSSEDDLAVCDSGCLRSFGRVQAIDHETAWAVGSTIGLCAICTNTDDYSIRRDSFGWHDGLPYTVTAAISSNGTPPPSLSLRGITFSSRDDGLTVGSRTDDGPADGAHGRQPQVLRYHMGAWAIEPIPVAVGDLHRVSMLDADHALAVGSAGLILGYDDAAAATPPPIARVNNPHARGIGYFGTTGHTLRGRFGEYWAAHGGLMQFGYPLTEEFLEQSPTDGHTYLMQYFERARFELHPENAPPYDILLGLLGRAITTTRNGEPVFPPVAGDGSGTDPETRQQVLIGTASTRSTLQNDRSKLLQTCVCCPYGVASENGTYSTLRRCSGRRGLNVPAPIVALLRHSASPVLLLCSQPSGDSFCTSASSTAWPVPRNACAARSRQTGLPHHNNRCSQVGAAGPLTLLHETAVVALTEAVDEHGLRAPLRAAPLFSLVWTRRRSPRRDARYDGLTGSCR